tara:strand:- start:93 stop:509 length:417 start_codon:yes stop_codon:yes gene_type:complete
MNNIANTPSERPSIRTSGEGWAMRIARELERNASLQSGKVKDTMKKRRIPFSKLPKPTQKLFINIDGTMRSLSNGKDGEQIAELRTFKRMIESGESPKRLRSMILDSEFQTTKNIVLLGHAANTQRQGRSRKSHNGRK